MPPHDIKSIISISLSIHLSIYLSFFLQQLNSSSPQLTRHKQVTRKSDTPTAKKNHFRSDHEQNIMSSL